MIMQKLLYRNWLRKLKASDSIEIEEIFEEEILIAINTQNKIGCLWVADFDFSI